MGRRVGRVAVLLLALLGLVIAAGCAGTRTERMSDNPELVRKEIAEIALGIRNVQELIKGSKAELQIEDSQDLRNELRSLEAELIHLESRKRALEEHLTNLSAQ